MSEGVRELLIVGAGPAGLAVAMDLDGTTPSYHTLQVALPQGV